MLGKYFCIKIFKLCLKAVVYSQLSENNTYVDGVIVDA